MKKNIVQDVIPPKKSIRNVKLSSRTHEDKPSKVIEEVEIEKEEDFTRPVTIRQQNPMRIEPVRVEKTNLERSIERPVPPAPAPLAYNFEYDTPKKTSKKGRYIAIGVFILAGAFGVSSLFKSAQIKITPRQEIKPLIDQVFVAKKDATSGGLGYQIVTVSKDVEKTVPATTEEKVDIKAQGRIVIYNNFNSQPQRLIATTRFETPEGLIYRLTRDVTVPGAQTVSGKTVAGSIEATVEADKTGADYNIGLKDFTIPGFKGTPRYAAFYARSKTEMTGGFSGMQKVVSKEVMDQAEKELEAELKAELSKDISSQIPSNFILFNEGITYKTNPIVQASSSTGDAILRKKGEINAIIFDRAALTRAILEKISPENVSETVKISNLESVTMSFPSTSVFNPETDTSLTFSLKGSAYIVWLLDENKLKTDLLGLSKTDAKTVIGSNSVVTEAWVETSPFWNQKIPKNAEKVTLINTANIEP